MSVYVFIWMSVHTSYTCASLYTYVLGVFFYIIICILLLYCHIVSFYLHPPVNNLTTQPASDYMYVSISFVTSIWIWKLMWVLTFDYSLVIQFVCFLGFLTFVTLRNKFLHKISNQRVMNNIYNSPLIKIQSEDQVDQLTFRL